jgi:RES domain-containing protein
VSITAWRITKRKHAKTAFTGAGARKYGGRWNSPGVALVYTAQNQALAVLEMLVHLENTELLAKYILLGVEINESFIQELDRSRLPKNWRDDPAPSRLRSLGDEWAQSQASAALRVPSTLVPAEDNLLLNPLHPDFKKMKIGPPVSFRFDLRLGR